MVVPTLSEIPKGEEEISRQETEHLSWGGDRDRYCYLHIRGLE